jgi:drug/metabolite transporter (DMT)-like permease
MLKHLPERAPGDAKQVPNPAPAKSRRLFGMALVVLAVTLFSCLDAIAKYLITTVGLPVTQVVWVRFLGAFITVVFALGAVNIPRLLASRRVKHQLLRSALLLGSTAFNFFALRTLRLDQTVTIQFLAPLVVALLAGPMLGEWVGWRRLVAICVGFCGILVVIRPGYGAFEPAMLLALCCMACYACFILLTRYLSAYDGPDVTMFYSLLVGTYAMAPLALVDWVWPAEPWIWALMIAYGAVGALGHYIFVIAHRHAPASTLAPFLYSQILSVTAIGWLIFGDLPDQFTIAGSAIIIASGLYLWHREQVVTKARAQQQ